MNMNDGQILRMWLETSCVGRLLCCVLSVLCAVWTDVYAVGYGVLKKLCIPYLTVQSY